MALRLVIAFGGNALAPQDERGTWQEQSGHARTAARALLELRADGHELVLTHGNGPQVGALALQQLAASNLVPPLPLDALGAMTQGQLGYLLQQALSSL